MFAKKTFSELQIKPVGMLSLIYELEKKQHLVNNFAISQHFEQFFFEGQKIAHKTEQQCNEELMLFSWCQSLKKKTKLKLKIDII